MNLGYFCSDLFYLVMIILYPSVSLFLLIREKTSWVMNLKSPVLALSSGIRWCRQNRFSLVLSSVVHMLTSSSAASLSTLVDNCLQELHPQNPSGSKPVGAARILSAGSAKS